MDLILAFLAGSGVGAAAGGLLLHVVRTHLRADLAVAQEAETARSEELAGLLRDVAARAKSAFTIHDPVN